MSDFTRPNETLEAVVPPAMAGRRVDAVMADLFPQYSRSRLTQWLKAGQALVDDQAVRPRATVHGGERIHLTVPEERRVTEQPQAIALHILHEDADVLVLDKPAGLVVHPGAGNPDGTLVNALLHHDPALQALPRAGIVHRLDKDTSGVMMVARTMQAHARLVEQLAARQVQREYLAVVVGAMVAGGVVDAPMDRHPRDRLRRAVREDGRPAITHYRLHERYRTHTAVQCRLETGRTHQIRVHMQHIRYPIVGDPLYGGPLKLPKGADEGLVEVLRGFRRQALHAHALQFEHPMSGESLRCQADIPEDMRVLMQALRVDADAHGQVQPG